MGNQASKECSTDQSILQKQPKNIDIKSLDLSISSVGSISNNKPNYNGMDIEQMMSNQRQIGNDNNDSDKTPKEKSSSESEDKDIIRIFWVQGGNEVFITGTFCNWDERKYKMNQIRNNIFEQELLLLKGKYEFKFIVDGVWRCSSFYDLKTDNNGFYNNYIDTTNINTNINDYNINKINKELNSVFNGNDNILKKGDIEELKKKYSNLYPREEQMNSEAPKTPDVFENVMDLTMNSRQKYIGKEKFFDYNQNNCEDSFKSIIPFYHSYLNHLFTPTNKNENENKSFNKKSTYFGINSSFNVNNKVISIVYYSPLNKT